VPDDGGRGAARGPAPEEAIAQGLVSDIIEIRANLDDIARRENKLRKAIHFFTVKRSGQDRCVSPRPLSRPYDGCRSNLPPTCHRQIAGWLSQCLTAMAVSSQPQLSHSATARTVERRPWRRPRVTDWCGRDDDLTMSRSFNRFSMKKPMTSFERHAYSSTGSLLDHTHIYSHLSPKRLR
jgi:hypothetical protein